MTSFEIFNDSQGLLAQLWSPTNVAQAFVVGNTATSDVRNRQNVIAQSSVIGKPARASNSQYNQVLAYSPPKKLKATPLSPDVQPEGNLNSYEQAFFDKLLEAIDKFDLSDDQSIAELSHALTIAGMLPARCQENVVEAFRANTAFLIIFSNIALDLEHMLDDCAVDPLSNCAPAYWTKPLSNCEIRQRMERRKLLNKIKIMSST